MELALRSAFLRGSYRASILTGGHAAVFFKDFPEITGAVEPTGKTNLRNAFFSIG